MTTETIFSRVENKDDLLKLLKNELPEYSQDYDKAFANLGTKYVKLIKLLKAMEFTAEDENRIFKYPNGLLKHHNLFNNEPFKYYNIDKEYTVINDLSRYQNEYIENELGVVIPVFKSSYNIMYLSGSEFYIATTKILIVNSIREGISFVTNNQVDGNKLDYLLKRIPEDVGCIILKDSGLVITISNTRILKKIVIKEKLIRKVFKKLNQIKQPYDINFLMEEKDGEMQPLKIVSEISDNDDILHLINQLYGFMFLREGENQFNNNEVLVSTGYKQCNIKFHIDSEGKVTYKESIFPVVDYRTIVGISLHFDTQKYQNHQICLIIGDEFGILFDPSYDKTFEDNIFIQTMYTDISRFFSTIEIYNNKYLECPFDYSFQHNMDDFYCISWSYYLGMLYCLNPGVNCFKYLYDLDREGLKIAITRFILFLTGDDPIGIYETIKNVRKS